MKSSTHSPGPARVAGGRRKYKRPFDLSILILAHAVLLPLWLFLWGIIPLFIWLGDRGPVFYRQKRVGLNAKDFTILKFRTMVLDSELKGPAWTTEGDSRVTTLGKLLRRTALDELPSVLSIWKGDMSLVGPRALYVGEQRALEQEIPGFVERLQVLPGLTGLAQVYDPIDDAHNKFHYDQEYIRRMGPWLDLKLLLLSVQKTLSAKWDRREGKMAGATLRLSSLDQDGHENQPSNRDYVKPSGDRRSD